MVYLRWNLALYNSDIISNRAISVEAKQWINENFSINFDDEMQANTEITEETKESLVS